MNIQWPERDTSITHPYLDKKKLNLNNAIIDGDNLCIPIIDPNGKRVGHQLITAEGRKKFSYQMPVTGNFSVIGGPIVDFAYVAEGWATAATIYEATGKPAVFGLNAGNIPAVVDNLLQAKPDCTFVVAGDNDEAGSGELWLFNPSSTTFVKHFFSATNHVNGDATSPYSIYNFGSGYGNTTSAVDAIQFQFHTGNIDAGVIKLYGISDS